jgi:hypothetical protein
VFWFVCDVTLVYGGFNMLCGNTRLDFWWVMGHGLSGLRFLSSTRQIMG